MSRLLDQETGQMLLSNYGNTFALGFKGDMGFIERSYNFAFNFCATNGALIELTQDMSYIITSPARIMNALKLYYYNEIIMTKEIEGHLDENDEYVINEVLAEKMATEKAQKFFETRIQKENFMFNMFLNRIKENTL